MRPAVFRCTVCGSVITTAVPEHDDVEDVMMEVAAHVAEHVDGDEPYTHERLESTITEIVDRARAEWMGLDPDFAVRGMGG